MGKGWYKYLIYLSIVFLLFGLYQANYLKVPDIHNGKALAVSVVLLCIGFLGQGLLWFATLRSTPYRSTLPEAMAAAGLSIFTKYIPGKVFVILGRAGYIAERHDYPVSKLSVLSLHAQLIAFWMALSIGSIGTFLMEGFEEWRWLIAVGWGALSLLIFSQSANKLLIKMVKLVLKKEINIPWLPFKDVVKILPAFAWPWIFFTLAFYALVRALHPDPIGFEVGFGLPLGTVVGIIAIIAPGGIGVREGVLVAYLLIAGLEEAAAVSIAVASRPWFLIGESFLFVFGWLCDRRLKS